MKKIIITIGALACVQAFAQVGPSDVCRNIARFNTATSSQCAQVISRSRFDQSVLNVANVVANSGSSANALRVLEIGANKRMDLSMEQTCVALNRFSTSATVTCVEASLDTYFAPAASNISLTIANAGASTNAILAIQNARGAELQDSAAQVCISMVRFSTGSAANCVATIANKEYLNGSERVCLDLANRGSSTSAITCLENSGVEYRPLPPIPTEIFMTSLQFTDIKRDVQRANNLLSRGNTTEARFILENVNRVLDEVSIQNNVFESNGPRGPRGPRRGGRRD